MARKRKRHRKVDPPTERAEREMECDGEISEEEASHKDSTTTNQAIAEPSAASDHDKQEFDEEEEEEDVRILLEPFTRDELLDLLTDACLRDPALLARLVASAASDTAHRRLFVHGLGPGATSAALAAAFSLFGALDECHAVADRDTGRCRGYGFVTFRRRPDARRALADASKRVDGRPVACQLASLGPVPSDTERKLFVANLPERAAHDELRGFFSTFGEIEEGPLSADRTTGRFRGYAIFFYKTPEGLRKALEEPNKVFDGRELQCRRAHRARRRKHAGAAPADTGSRSNGCAAAVALPGVQSKELAMASQQPLLGSNPPVSLTATVLFHQNAAAGGAGILGASPVATVLPSSSGQSTSSTLPSSGAALAHARLSDCDPARAKPMVPPTTGANNSVSSLQVQGSAAKNSIGLSSLGVSTPASQPGQWTTRPGLIQHYLRT